MKTHSLFILMLSKLVISGCASSPDLVLGPVGPAKDGAEGAGREAAVERHDHGPPAAAVLGVADSRAHATRRTSVMVEKRLSSSVTSRLASQG